MLPYGVESIPRLKKTAPVEGMPSLNKAEHQGELSGSEVNRIERDIKASGAQINNPVF